MEKQKQKKPWTYILTAEVFMRDPQPNLNISNWSYAIQKKKTSVRNSGRTNHKVLNILKREDL